MAEDGQAVREVAKALIRMRPYEHKDAAIEVYKNKDTVVKFRFGCGFRIDVLLFDRQDNMELLYPEPDRINGAERSYIDALRRETAALCRKYHGLAMESIRKGPER